VIPGNASQYEVRELASKGRVLACADEAQARSLPQMWEEQRCNLPRCAR
jgi:hypothetical protein